MATGLKEKLKEKEKQIKLAKVTNRLKEVTGKVVKAAKHLAQETKMSPKIVEALENLTTREEMIGILEHPAKQQRKCNRLAENRFAALSEEEEIYHGCYPTVTELCATTEARDNQINIKDLYQSMSMANRTMPEMNDDISVGTTQSTNTGKSSNCSNIMPTKTSMMTR